MLERFQGKDGRAALLTELRTQFLIDGNSEIAEKIASGSQVKEHPPGSALFTQGERGAELSFILTGRVSVRVDDREIATCNAGMHVGEISLLEPFKGRSATVVALEPVVVAQISSQKFTDIAQLHPQLWRRVAMELARRLVQTQAKGLDKKASAGTDKPIQPDHATVSAFGAVLARA